jgi:hypothetical protein
MKESTVKIKFRGFDFVLVHFFLCISSFIVYIILVVVEILIMRLNNVLTAIFRITDTDVPLISSSLSYIIKGACDIYIILFIIITRLTDKRP